MLVDTVHTARRFVIDILSRERREWAGRREMREGMEGREREEGMAGRREMRKGREGRKREEEIGGLREKRGKESMGEEREGR